jgi:PKHD-type hydroxylase
MRLRHAYRVWQSYLPAEACDRAVGAGEKCEGYESVLMKDATTRARDSTIAWINRGPENAWLFDAIDRCVSETNGQVWRFNLTGSENLQYTKYKRGQHYGWHFDQFEDPFPDGSRWPGLIRKLSVTVNLTDGADYEGGDFEIEHPPVPPAEPRRNAAVVTEARARGSVVVFPAFLYHRVTEVTRGTRIALVTWYLGPPYV